MVPATAGQNRNKTQACVRCFHRPSNSMGVCQEERSQTQNKQIAFKRCTETKSFQIWLKMEHNRRLGMLEDIDKKVDAMMLQTKLEVKDENGRWVKNTELKITEADVKEIKGE